MATKSAEAWTRSTPIQMGMAFRTPAIQTQADDGYLRQSILDPAGQVVDGFLPIMPTYKGQVSEEDVLQLISYIKSLSIPKAAPSHPAEENQ